MVIEFFWIVIFVRFRKFRRGFVYILISCRDRVLGLGL